MKKIITLFGALLFFFFLSNAQNQVALNRFSSGYTEPLAIENCGDSRLFIVQQPGQIIISDSTGKRRATPYLDISDRIFYNGGELGLLGLAFDPDYNANGFFYVHFTNKDKNIQISRFKVSRNNPNKAIASSEKIILVIQKPAFVSHNGGCLRFGPDGYLYCGIGDGGGEGDPNNYAQNPMSLLGKMLRIDVHKGNPYAIPPDNPFVDSPNYKKEIWALGLRNPWRWSFDALNGNIFIGDVGQQNWEEVDQQLAGKGGINYGWRCYEGKHPYNTSGCKAKSFYTLPIYEYSHATGDCSVTGGFVYRGAKYQTIYGKYFFADYCTGIIKTLTKNGKNFVEENVYDGNDHAYTSFGENYKRELYLTDFSNGNIYHIVPATSRQIAGNTFTSLEVAPNPSHGNIELSFVTEKIQPVTIIIQNVLGQSFYKQLQTSISGKNILNIHLTVPQGDYYIILIDAAGNVISKQLRIE